MSWELILGIIGFLFGSGALGIVFSAGRKHGETNSEIKTLGEEIKKIREEISLLQSGHSSTNLTNASNCQTHKELIRKDLEEKARIIHARIDSVLQEKNNENDSVGKLRQQVEAIVTGIQTQRGEWETLKGDIRGLLKAEAASTVEIINLKKRLDIEEERVNKHAEKLAADRADLDRLLRGK